MPRGLRRFQESGHSHFVTFSCCHRRPYFATDELFDLFIQSLEGMRARFDLRVYGYVVMPEHVHLLLSEPAGATLAEAIHYLKLSFAKRARGLRSASSQVSAQRTGANRGTKCWDHSGRNATMTGTCATTGSSLANCAIYIEIR
jgi:REP element-mobilizing transposase RayT